MKYILSIIILVASFQLKAQQKLSLSEAIQLGLEENYEILIQSISSEQAFVNNTWGNAGRYPILNFEASINENLNYGAGITLNWTLFDGFSVNITKQRLDEMQKLSNGNFTVVVEGTIQSIILAYFNVLLQEEKLTVYKNMEALSKDRLNYEKLRNELGASMSYELLQFKNSYLADQSNVLLQEANVKSALRNLKYLIGNKFENIELSDSLVVNPTHFKLDDLKYKLEQSNSTIKNQYINLVLLQKDIDLANANYYPTIELSAKGQVTNQSGANLFGSLTLSYNLFNGGNRKRAMQIALLEKNTGEIQLADAKASLQNQLMNLLDYYNARTSIYKLSVEQLEMARINLQISSEKLKAGVINSFDYRSVQLNMQNAALNNLDAIYNLIDANTSLLRVTGGIISEYKN